jgi:hypothetical protein
VISTLNEVITVAVPGFFALWLIATAATTVEGMLDDDYLPNSVFIGVLAPNWNFFSPRPGRWDFHLLYRDRLSDGSLTGWTQLMEFSETTDHPKWLWNTATHRAKFLFDTQQQLTTTFQELDAVQEMEPGDLQTVDSQEHITTTSYLLLLNYVTEKPHHEDATQTQFMIMRSTELEQYEPAVLFVSNFHDID